LGGDGAALLVLVLVLVAPPQAVEMASTALASTSLGFVVQRQTQVQAGQLMLKLTRSMRATST
jgi:hypothetical protein